MGPPCSQVAQRVSVDAVILTIRIVLSFILFFILMAGYFLGWFQPHGMT